MPADQGFMSEHDVDRFFCWYCYAGSPRSQGSCSRCGRPVEGPAEADYTDRLLWALRHPLPDRRIVAARALGMRREARAVVSLRELVYDPDPYLAAAALEALARIIGARCHGLLVQAAGTGTAPVRAVARRLLTDAGR